MEIVLTRGQVTIVDDEDFEELNALKWQFYPTYGRANVIGYAVRGIRYRKPDGSVAFYTERMHRRILGAEPGEYVDHANGDGLDNRRSNLRICTVRQNLYNRKKLPGPGGGPASSIYKGVDWNGQMQKWRARIALPDGKRITVGQFDDEVLAARAYDGVALEVHGEFARLNFEVAQ